MFAANTEDKIVIQPNSIILSLLTAFMPLQSLIHGICMIQIHVWDFNAHPLQAPVEITMAF